MNYPYIVAWDNWIGCPELTLSRNLELAESTNAPYDACYYDSDKEKWITYSDITNTVTRKYINKELRKLGILK